ncbi:ABC transporter permease [Amylibacter marinus]|uniref:TRAP transporter small permease protein n=1 Tax=Amylibacter marinus TaxID=1475483 RepID=A0ABQ5VY99_9RHOB|nr:TRAP transporter small permease [Amylibacter marinus]GLQ36179.1 ABC transporter permease [Amylibacter marinus]
MGVDNIKSLIDELEEVSDDISDVRWMDIPVLGVFSVLFFIVALQFFTRYVLNDSLGWTEEIARYLLILLGFIGGITCVRKGKHIYLEFIFGYLPRQIIKPIVVLTEVLVTYFWGYCGWLAIELAQKSRSNMVSIDLPKAYVYYIVSAGCFFMALFAALKFLEAVRKPSDQVAREKAEAQSEGI